METRRSEVNVPISGDQWTYLRKCIEEAKAERMNMYLPAQFEDGKFYFYPKKIQSSKIILTHYSVI